MNKLEKNSLIKREDQVAQDLMSYLRHYHSTMIAIYKAIEDTAEIYSLTSEQVRRIFYNYINMTPEEWCIKAYGARGIYHQTRPIQVPPNFLNQSGPIPRNKSLVLVEGTKIDHPTISIKTPWEKFVEIVEESKN